jgi:hypothetical protein
MTTIIERPEGGGSGMVVIAAVVGALAAGVIGLFAFGAFDRNPASTTVTVEQPATPTATAPPAQSAPAPTEQTAPSTEPPPPATPDTTEPEPAAPPAPPAQ